ncbi:MAG TPA: sigma 54-interacting transcriptional regulator [Kofleriaceae bacterium]|nr:sigma 54-interacting transcriptional regulator [Kofleriaceae bacterium]
MGRVEAGGTRGAGETASIEEHRRELSGRPSYLLVIENGSSSLFDLPATGVVTIGRGPEVELRLDHSSVSRRHAHLLLDRGEVRVSDMGSRNGTRVNGETLTQPRVLATGDLVAIGEVLLVVHAPARRAAPRDLIDEQAWRQRLAEEVDRAVSYARPLAVLAIAGVPAAARAGAAGALAGALRGIDTACAADDGQLLIVLPEADRPAAHRMAAAIAGALGSTAPGARIGVATCPWDAADMDSLLLAARAGARVAAEGAVVAAGEAVIRLALGEREVLLAHPAMVRVFELLERLAASDLPVLVIGETGSGKENAAFAVHHRSARRDRPFVPLNCAALPETLVESELFGFDRGAFSGAVAARAGLLESVAGGTLFLDEVGELALPVQAKLLRALETQRITRLGEHRERPIDVRLVAATHRALEDEIAAGRFRQDLYFRIGGARVVLPPLRDRRCEIPILFREFLSRAAVRAGRAAPEPTPAVMAVLLAHSWPGNVRELRHVAEYLAATVLGPTIELDALPLDLAPRIALPATTTATPPTTAIAAPMRRLADELAELERRRIGEALAAAGGVKTHAAQLLGMPVRTLSWKLKQHGIQ